MTPAEVFKKIINMYEKDNEGLTFKEYIENVVKIGKQILGYE